MELSLQAYQKLIDTYAIPWGIKKVMTRAKVEETFDEKNISIPYP